MSFYWPKTNKQASATGQKYTLSMYKHLPYSNGISEDAQDQKTQQYIETTIHATCD